MNATVGINHARGAEEYRDEHVEIDFSLCTLRVDAQAVRLTRKEYGLLALMAQNAGEIIPRGVLLERVWGYSREVRTRTLDVHIRRLRKKLIPYGDRYIETVFGVGYRFQPYREPRPFSAITSTMAVA